MYLKIEADGEEQFYSFENKKIVTIGRAPECDVQLLVEGVSRDHLLIMETDHGDFKFIDLGSTNGTYVNGQLIEKDVETDFNSFFPIKLGSQVYVYLIDEVSAGAVKEEVKQNNEEKKKSLIDFPIDSSETSEEASGIESPEDLKEKKRKQLQDRIYVPKSKPVVTDHETTRVIKRPSIAVASASAKKREKNSPNKFTMLLGLLAGIGLAYYFSPEEPAPKKAPVTAKAPIAPKKKVIPKTHAEKMMGLASLDKCLGETESALCGELKKTRDLKHKEGFLKFASKLYLVVRMDGVSEGYSNYKLSRIEEAELLKAMALNLGRQFSESKIRGSNLVFERPDLNSDLAKNSALFVDLALSGALKKAGELEGLNEVTVVLVNNGEFVQSADLGESSIKELQKESFQKNLVYYWRSGLSRPLSAYFAGEEGKALTKLIQRK